MASVNKVPQRFQRHALAALAILAMTACGQKQETAAPAAPAPGASAAAPMPDVGKVDTVVTKADGYGVTPAAATADAMKAAILQVNGATIDTSSVQVKYGLDVTDGVDAVSLRATEFAERVAQKSGGAITQFRVIALTEPAVKGGQYKASIEAHIAHFTAPVDKKLKVVISNIKFDVPAFDIGGEMVPAAKVAADIRGQVAAALGNTGRFAVMERDDGEAIDQELDMIRSGAAPRAETGKLGQAATADLVWIGHIDTLAYARHARALRTSDRELVSYSGGWGVTQKLVNVATRQVMTSDALRGKAPDIAPTTMGSSINGAQVLQDMETSMARDIVASIVGRTFPITVLSVQGADVVLSQGGDTLKAGSRYAVVTMGAEMKDPQTGESLGRTEKSCCVAVIDRVTPKLSYAHLVGEPGNLTGLAPASLQLREMLPAEAAPVAAAAPAAGAESAAPLAATAPHAAKAVRRAAAVEDSKEDGKW